MVTDGQQVSTLYYTERERARQKDRGGGKMIRQPLGVHAHIQRERERNIGLFVRCVLC